MLLGPIKIVNKKLMSGHERFLVVVVVVDGVIVVAAVVVVVPVVRVDDLVSDARRTGSSA